MKTITKKIEIYQFHELSEEIQQAVADQLGEDMTHYRDWWNDFDGIFKEICAEYGINYEKIHSFNIEQGSFAFIGDILDYKVLLKKAGNIDLRTTSAKACIDNITIDVVGINTPHNKIDLNVEDDIVFNKTCQQLIEDNIQSVVNRACYKCLQVLKDEYDCLYSIEYAKEISECNESWYTKKGEIIENIGE